MATGKDPIAAIANTLFSSDEAASQAPAPASEAATGGTLGDDGEDAEGTNMVDLTSLEGEAPQVKSQASDAFAKGCTHCACLLSDNRCHKLREKAPGIEAVSAWH